MPVDWIYAPREAHCALTILHGSSITTCCQEPVVSQARPPALWSSDSCPQGETPSLWSCFSVRLIRWSKHGVCALWKQNKPEVNDLKPWLLSWPTTSLLFFLSSDFNSYYLIHFFLWFVVSLCVCLCLSGMYLIPLKMIKWWLHTNIYQRIKKIWAHYFQNKLWLYFFQKKCFCVRHYLIFWFEYIIISLGGIWRLPGLILTNRSWLVDKTRWSDSKQWKPIEAILRDRRLNKIK